MASVMKKVNANVIKKGCQENQLVPGRDRTVMNTVKTIQTQWVSTAEPVLV